MSNTDTHQHAEWHWQNVGERVSWWRVVDAFMATGAPIHSAEAVRGLYK
jgi:hypothetical protein